MSCLAKISWKRGDERRQVPRLDRRCPRRTRSASCRPSCPAAGRAPPCARFQIGCTARPARGRRGRRSRTARAAGAPRALRPWRGPRSPMSPAYSTIMIAAGSPWTQPMRCDCSMLCARQVEDHLVGQLDRVRARLEDRLRGLERLLHVAVVDDLERRRASAAAPAASWPRARPASVPSEPTTSRAIEFSAAGRCRRPRRSAAARQRPPARSGCSRTRGASARIARADLVARTSRGCRPTSR